MKLKTAVQTAILSGFGLSSLMAQTPNIWIAPMEGQLDGFITAELVKQHVPVQVVTERSQAQYAIEGLAILEQDSKVYYHRATDLNVGNVRMVDIQRGTVLWAGEAGDRSLSFNLYGIDVTGSGRRRQGLRKVAERIVERMKAEAFAGQSAQLASVNGVVKPKHTGFAGFALNNNGGY
jgi:hypothetical protein